MRKVPPEAFFVAQNPPERVLSAAILRSLCKLGFYVGRRSCLQGRVEWGGEVSSVKAV